MLSNTLMRISDMEITISKTDFNALMTLIDRCTAIIQDKQPTIREYNAARRLRLIKKKMARRYDGKL